MNEPKPVDGREPGMTVLALSGSCRKASFNTALLCEADGLAPAGMRVTLYDFSDVPQYDDDVRMAGFPPEVERLREAIRASDAVVIASPEYNRSVPGVLKNAIDWASRGPDQPFAGKPLAIMSVSQGALGGAFANHHLRQIFVYLDARMINGPEVMIGNAKAKFDEDRKLTDPVTRDFVAGHLGKLARAVEDGRRSAAGR